MECCQEVAARRKAQNPGQEGDSVGYEDLGEAAYGPLGRKIVTTTMYTELLGICSLLFILEVRLPSAGCNALALHPMNVALHLALSSCPATL